MIKYYWVLRIIKVILFTSLPLLLSSCMMSPTKPQLNVVSDPPGAEVSLILRGGVIQKLGPTPLIVDEATLSRAENSVLRLRLEKVGYEVESLFLDLVSGKVLGEVNVKMNASVDWKQAYVDPAAKRYLEDVANLTAEIQGALMRNDSVRAEQQARTLVTRYPNLAVGWTLLGNVFYLQNRRSEALESYNKSLSLDPANTETKRVIDRMMKM